MCEDGYGGPNPVRFARRQPWRACSATPGKTQVAFGGGKVFFLEADGSVTALLTNELSDCMGATFQPATSGKKYALIAPTPRVGLCGLSLDQRTIECYPNWGYVPIERDEHWCVREATINCDANRRAFPGTWFDGRASFGLSAVLCTWGLHRTSVPRIIFAPSTSKVERVAEYFRTRVSPS
jgi:hypothetical protein